MSVSPIQIAVGLNMILDMYLKLKKQWPQVTPDDIKKYIETLEGQADTNDKILGIKS